MILYKGRVNIHPSYFYEEDEKMETELDSALECRGCGKIIARRHVLPLYEPNPIKAYYYTIAAYNEGHHSGYFCKDCYLNEIKRRIDNGESDLHISKNQKDCFYTEIETETENEKE